MGIGNIENDFPFLNDVELRNNTKNGLIIKTVKFNEDEYILLKFLEYYNKKFSPFIKELLIKEIYNTLGNKQDDFKQEEINSLTKIDEEYLMELIEKVMIKNNKKVTFNHNESNNIKVDDSDLECFGIKKR